MSARYSRQVMLEGIGPEGQARLEASKVLVVGAGGLGSAVLPYLAAAGVGALGVVDGDFVDESNLHRQVLYTEQDMGASKAHRACDALEKLNPRVSLRPYPLYLDEGWAHDICPHYDVVVDGSDHFGTRYLLNKMCYTYKKPLVSGALSQFSGQLTTFKAYEEGPCYACVFPHASGEDSCGTMGVLGPVAGVIGTLQAVEVVKCLLGLGRQLVGTLLLYEALTTTFRSFPVEKVETCSVCGG